MKIKQLIPSVLKLQIRLVQRFFNDRKSPLVFAENKHLKVELPYSICETQPIKQSSYFQNKIDNIKLGANRIQQITIEPNETLSFWRIIGNPTKQNGFKIGRNLINGKLTADYGGGLCQLSGIMYITALYAGLEIIERYNHTLDIYKEEERFTPLGADATIVYGHKDLRIKNPYAYPIQFTFEVRDNKIDCHLKSQKEITRTQIEYKRTEFDGGVKVDTYINSQLAVQSVYNKEM